MGQVNVDRLKEYKSKVILYPRYKKKRAKNEATPEEIKMASQYKGTIMPITKKLPVLEGGLIEEKYRKANMFSIQRQEMMTVRKWGARKKKAEEAAAEAAVLKK